MSESRRPVIAHAPAPAIGRPQVARDLWALTKPRITLMVVITAAGGMWLAPTTPGVASLVVALAALGLVVGSANALNCWFERDIDGLMARTARRPLPAKRLTAGTSLLFSLLLGFVAVPALIIAVNPLTGLLAVLSLLIYVGIYTPMKQFSPLALWVGAVPGAMPPLMGWTAATGTVDAPALVLFGILFLWQLPHFMAIAVFRQAEYERAGIRVLPATQGRRAALWHTVGWSAALLPVSLLPQVVGVAGPLYTAIAAAAGTAYLVVAVQGLGRRDATAGARRLFVASLLYLPIVFAALMIDAA